jgi:hypothetical protein
MTRSTREPSTPFGRKSTSTCGASRVSTRSHPLPWAVMQATGLHRIARAAKHGSGAHQVVLRAARDQREAAVRQRLGERLQPARQVSMGEPRIMSTCMRAWQLLSTCFWYALNSGLAACFSATARPAMVWLCGPPCEAHARAHSRLRRARVRRAARPLVPPLLMQATPAAPGRRRS